MKIAVPKETKEGENRVAITPEVTRGFIKAGFEVAVESGAGMRSFFSDDDYRNAGAQVAASAPELYAQADVVAKINPPLPNELQQMKQGTILISFLFARSNMQLTEALASSGISAFSMDAIPRISRAQKMDALSSQSNLAGYKAVMLGANALGKIFPMLMTAAGTVKPSKVVIMGAGVAGLQAIATAKRLGAVVEVSDIRPETKEQCESLGGKFIEVKTDESVQTGGGYVTGVSEDFLRRQQELLFKHITQADLVITTALIPGKKAPLLVTADMVHNMRPGSVVVDMAVEQGGNCELSKLNEYANVNGVTIIGIGNIPSLLPVNASELYARNIQAFLQHLATKDGFKWEMDEEITKGSLITHQGKILLS